MGYSRFAPSSIWHQLRGMIPAASYVNCGNIVFREVATRAQACGPGVLYVALSGSAHREGEFLRQAVERGACGLLTDFPMPDLPRPQCIVTDVRKTYGLLMHGLVNNPARKLTICGVTGTNGKTTITWMLRSIWRAEQRQAGLLGTIEYDDGERPPEPARLTTPDAATLAEWMLRMSHQRTTHLAMEVSSHALDQQRLAGVSLSAGVISNITRDHLDYHGSFAEYAAAKGRIVEYLRPDAPLIVNGDDAHTRKLLESCEFSDLPVITVGFGDTNQVKIQVLNQTLTWARFSLELPGEHLQLEIPLPGQHNILNAALAAVAASRTGASQRAIQQGLRELSPPPGRLEPVEVPGCPFHCFIDYAHTPDAMRQVLSTLRTLTPGNLLCVFGAGGGRDREKRPEMAQAALLADRIVLTADNSREEPTPQIFRDILAGFPQDREPDLVCEDRAEAIDWAISQAQPGDCVVILGKGHETGQQIGSEILDFHDAEQARASIYSHNPQISCLPLRFSA